MPERDVHFIPAQATKEQWMGIDKIPYRGELLIEIGGETPQLKIGDGLRPYRDLPYFEITMVNAILGRNIRHVVYVDAGSNLDRIPNETLIIEGKEIS